MVTDGLQITAAGAIGNSLSAGETREPVLAVATLVAVTAVKDAAGRGLGRDGGRGRVPLC